MASTRRGATAPAGAGGGRSGEFPFVCTRDKGDAAAGGCTDWKSEVNVVEGGVCDCCGACAGVGGWVSALGGIVGGGYFEDDADEYLDHGVKC